MNDPNDTTERTLNVRRACGLPERKSLIGEDVKNKTKLKCNNRYCNQNNNASLKSVIPELDPSKNYINSWHQGQGDLGPQIGTNKMRDTLDAMNLYNAELEMFDGSGKTDSTKENSNIFLKKNMFFWFILIVALVLVSYFIYVKFIKSKEIISKELT